jgi:hypothetical protein
VLPHNCRVWKKADLFTRLVELHRILFKDKIGIHPQESGKHLAEFYERVDKVSAGVEENGEIGNYYKASIQATNDRSSRIIRGQVLRKALLGEL